MRLSILIPAMLLTACGGQATQKDDTGGQTPPDATGYVETDEVALKTTPYMTQWRLNEVYGDTTGLAGVAGTFAFTATETSELKIGFEEVQVTECTEPGGANPTYTLVRADGSQQNLGMEQAFVVAAQEAIKLRVSQPNLAKCHSIDVLVGVNIRGI